MIKPRDEPKPARAPQVGEVLMKQLHRQIPVSEIRKVTYPFPLQLCPPNLLLDDSHKQSGVLISTTKRKTAG